MIKTVVDYADIDRIIDFLLECPVVYFDTETTGLDPHTGTLLLLSIHGNNGINEFTFVFDILRMGVEVLHQLKAIFHNPAILKVAHNAVFDWKWLYHNADVYTSPVYCTMIAEQVVQAGLLFSGFSLADVTERRLGRKLDKSVREQFIERDLNIPFSQEELAYAGEDTVVLEPIYMQQRDELIKKDLSKIINLECQLIPITSQLEYNGIEINEERLRAAQPVVMRVIEDATQKLQDEIISSGAADEITFSRDGYSAINVGSPKQMLQALNAIGVDTTSLSKKELSDWDAKWAIKHKKLAASSGGDDEFDVGYAHPVLRQHAIRTAAAKLEGTYISGLIPKINPITRRIHPGYKQCGAPATGRMSGVNPKVLGR